MTKNTRNDFSKLKSYFLRNKRKVVKALSISLLFFIGTIAITGLKLFYPYHFLIAFVLLVHCIYFFTKAFLFDKHKVENSETYHYAKKSYRKHRILIFSILLALVASYVVWTVFPYANNPFSNISVEERSKLIKEDTEVATVLLDNLEIAGDELLNSPLLKNKEFTASESQELKDKWNYFISVAIESEKVTDIHKYFNRINIFKYPADHSESFIISYSLYMKKFEIFHKLISTINNNDAVAKQLNEFSPVFKSQNSYDDVLQRFFSTDSVIRRNLGIIYIHTLNLAIRDEKLSEGYFVLESESKKSQKYLFNNVFNTAISAARERRYRLEKDLSGIWFPVQKNIANIMGETYMSNRHEKFITIPQILEMKKVLEPGDIFVQRRNWYASNIGIPGFWAHGALYTGTIADMNSYFAQEFPFNGHNDISTLLAKDYPEVYKKLLTTDENQYQFAVIEGKSPGIIFQSLEQSAHADYLAALRPKLSKEDKLKALLRAFESYGKPYDYDFDFETRDALVCSELIYDAYQTIGDKKGLTFDLTMTNGRKIVSPTDMVKKYYEERESLDRELDFVYFLDGNEDLGRAFVKDESEFFLTWQRPKYSWFQQ